MEESLDKLSRQRFTRFTQQQDEVLEKLARREGLTVAAMIRQACIHRFNLPTDGSETSDVEDGDSGNVSNGSRHD